MALKIDSYIPTPLRRKPRAGSTAGLSRALQLLDVNDSVFLAETKRGQAASTIARATAREYATGPRQFTTKEMPEGLRIWRIA